MQFRPRLTGESGSPWVATTRPFCTPTSTEQPVPQKRQAALSQRTLVPSGPLVCASATTGMPMPAGAAAAAIALVLMNSRRSMVISCLQMFETFVGVFVGERHAVDFRCHVHRSEERRVG